MQPKCDHKWIDMKNGTLDQICVRCCMKQMRNVMAMPLPEISVQPITVHVNVCTHTVEEIIGELSRRLKHNGRYHLYG